MTFSIAANPFSMTEIAEYGKSTALSAASVATKITASTKAGDIEEVGKALSALLVGAGEYDPEKIKGGGFLGFFQKSKRQIEARYQTIDQQVKGLADDVDKQIKHFSARIGDLEGLFEENKAQHTELGRIMVTAAQRIQWMKDNPPLQSGDAFSAQNIANWNSVISYGEKRIDDLRRAQLLCELQGPQIQMMKENASLLVMKFGEVKATTLPQLQMSFSLYIANLEAEKGAAFSKEIDDKNNSLISANAAKLGLATVNVKQQMARSSIDISTLQLVKEKLFETMEAAQKIQTELATRLATERPQLETLSRELSEKLSK